MTVTYRSHGELNHRKDESVLQMTCTLYEHTARKHGDDNAKERMCCVVEVQMFVSVNQLRRRGGAPSIGGGVSTTNYMHLSNQSERPVFEFHSGLLYIIVDGKIG